MRERPILFSTPMVRAILEGRKTQTRRPVTQLHGFGRIREFGPSDTPGYAWHFRDRAMRWNDLRDESLKARCPFGVPGDRLWVRETWADAGLRGFRYRADGPSGSPYGCAVSDPNCAGGWECDCWWRPSIHMPRAACRALLDVTDVRVARLQQLSESDALAEGVDGPMCAALSTRSPWLGQVAPAAVHAFAALWDSINGAGAWSSNPWVWVVNFRAPRTEVPAP